MVRDCFGNILNAGDYVVLNNLKVTETPELHEVVTVRSSSREVAVVKVGLQSKPELIPTTKVFRVLHENYEPIWFG